MKVYVATKSDGWDLKPTTKIFRTREDAVDQLYAWFGKEVLNYMKDMAVDLDEDKSKECACSCQDALEAFKKWLQELYSDMEDGFIYDGFFEVTYTISEADF